MILYSEPLAGNFVRSPDFPIHPLQAAVVSLRSNGFSFWQLPCGGRALQPSLQPPYCVLIRFALSVLAFSPLAFPFLSPYPEAPLALSLPPNPRVPGEQAARKTRPLESVPGHGATKAGERDFGRREAARWGGKRCEEHIQEVTCSRV